MSQQAYIVVGHTGEYDDYNTWPVVAYAHEPAAEEHAAKANAWCVEHEYDGSTAKYASSLEDHGNPWDPSFHADYTGTHYTVVSVPSRINRVRPVPAA